MKGSETTANKRKNKGAHSPESSRDKKKETKKVSSKHLILPDFESMQ
jgi:hypothetical protein